MAKEERIELLKGFEKRRKSRAILFVLGDRQPIQLFGTLIAMDIIPLTQKLVGKMSQSKKISLIIYSAGGDLFTPWPLVNLLRGFAKELEVIVLRKALSAATLVSLGSDRIVMCPFSNLSAIDPQGTFQTPEGKIEQISIEDILKFIEFAREKIGLKDRAGKIEILKALGRIDPKVLGNINRTHSLILKLATDLLKLRSKNRLSDTQIKNVVSNLTEKTFAHMHLIGRSEAKNKIGLGSMIEFADEKTNELMENMYTIVESDLQLETPFDLQEELKRNAPNAVTVTATRSIAQSTDLNYEGKSTIVIHPNGQVQQPSFKWELV
ncbi:MAG TPA: hypothetical protein VLX91_15715 [Candidatus Acidoferrales bacterium]|nr:hypothetical protein [Candidatus Acidoferrales bacterium]